ncbi:hypothetical protein [uncultured Tenacibaculum sp.]|uniref:hypothetical protein n=1 Tax=uncultured Tenacibaculum sp. TaxID=174713 RepID=UPI0014048B35|nr:hypothetical protein [uncultured Tenacibaculum sp.]
MKKFYSDMYLNGSNKYNGSLEKSRAALDYKYFSNEMKHLIKTHYLTIPRKDSHTTISEKTSEGWMLTSIGKVKNILGFDIEIKRKFLIKKIDKRKKIVNSQDLISFNLNFKVEHKKWDYLWDLQKNEIINDITKNLKLEVVSSDKEPLSNNLQEGKLKIVNNSDYDVKNIEIVIDHFDADGISVNTDVRVIKDIIRSKGYREFNWSSYDCSKCVSQKYKVNFFED